MTHTPGKWSVDFAGNVWAKDCKVADVSDPRQDAVYRNAPVAEREANARLIAAAPDLLEACQAVAASGMRNAAYDACIAAIARARGESA